MLKKLQNGKIIPEIEGLIFHPDMHGAAGQALSADEKALLPPKKRATRARPAKGQVRDYAFFFGLVDPEIMPFGGEFPKGMVEYVNQIKDAPRQPSVDEIRIVSRREMHKRRCKLMDKQVVEFFKLSLECPG